MQRWGKSLPGTLGEITRAVRFAWRAFLLLLLLLVAVPLHADPLGAFLLEAIVKNPGKPPSDATLLLLTTDLGWYEQNMSRLPQAIQDQVQQLRVRVVGESARQAAESLGESADVFLASGSCKAGRDIDLLYVGNNTSKARSSIDAAIGETTAAILANDAGDDFLAAARSNGLTIPSRLNSDALEVVASDLPNFGYADLKDALARAKAAQQAGDANAIELLEKELREALKKNLEAQVRSSAKDMYRGGAGQRFFVLDYLGDENKVRWIAQDAAGNWVLKPGGFEALSDNLREQVMALMPTSRRAKFAKVASDYAMFFKHGEGGLGGTAKYVDRIWGDVDDVALLLHMDADEQVAFMVARGIARNPENASAMLSQLGMWEEQVTQGVQRAMRQAVQNQLILDVDRLVKELDQIQGDGALDALDVLYRKHLLQFDLNDMANGLAAIADVPGEDAKEILKVLSGKFGGSESGKRVLGYIERQLDLLRGDGGSHVATRLLRHLWATGQIEPADYYEARMHLSTGQSLPDGPVARKLQQARQEILVLGAVDMMDLTDDPKSIENLIEEWKRQRSGALIVTGTPEVRQTIRELGTLPAEDLKKLGWLDVEIQLPMEMRLRLKLLPEQVVDLGQRLGRRLSRQAIALAAWQRRTREYIFSLTPTQFGSEGDLGPMDAVFAVASGMLQTYMILNSDPPMTAEEENLALANAWVTSLPIVGDFADGIIGGIEAGFSGDRRKALESGLYIAIGVMGVVPGGQIPAMVTGLLMATAPIAEGVLDARNAQSLIQAWIASGSWEGGGDQPLVLNGLFDRAQAFHDLTYQDLLSEKGDRPYQSELADGLFTVPTINASIRDYAERYVFPQYPRIAVLRDTLKTVFTDTDEQYWDRVFGVRLMDNDAGKPVLQFDTDWVAKNGGKGAVLLVREYAQLRIQALNQTIARLKEWAEEERRVAQNYDGEVEKLRQKLRELQTELNIGSLVGHAERSADSYAKVIKNAMEHETLPLSRYRIYKHYVQEYQQIVQLVRRIKARMAEIPNGYQPANWFLTGYPEFDRPRITKLAAMIENGRKGVVEKVTRLIDDFGFRGKGGFDPGNPCHSAAFNTLAALRHKVSFIENLAEYYQTLADNESAWSDAYEAARVRYVEVRDTYAGLLPLKASEVENKALSDAAMTFVFAMPYALAAGERDFYRRTASDYAIRLETAKREYEFAGFLTGDAGKPLELCLLQSLKVEVTLKPYNPLKGSATIATASLTSGSPPSEYYWRWQLDGPLSSQSPYGEKIEVKVDGAGMVVAQLTDHFNRERAKVLAEGRATVVPSELGDEPGKGDPDSGKEGGKPADDDGGKVTATAAAGDLAAAVAAARQARDWQRLTDLLEAEKATRREQKPDTYLERIGTINQALQDIKQDRLAWLVKWKAYLVALQQVNDASWNRIYHAMERKRDEFQEKCNAGCRDCREQCEKQAYQYHEDCVGRLKEDHWAEGRRIRESLKVLPDIVFRLDSAGYEHEQWFREVEELSKAHRLPFPYPDPVVPQIAYVTKCLDQEAPLVPTRPEQPPVLTVKLGAPADAVAVGRPVSLNASISGGKPPYSYSWSGAVGSGAHATLTPLWAGDWSVSVEVADADGAQGTGLATVRAAPATMKLEGLDGQVFYGSTAVLNAAGLGVGPRAPVVDAGPNCPPPYTSPFCVDTSIRITKQVTTPPEDLGRGEIYIVDPDKEFPDEPPPATADKVIWQSEPGLTFEPPESNSDITTVTYDRMGEVKVWCERLAQVEGAYHTVGECEQETTKVGPPSFVVSFEPADGQAHIGQRVIATVHARPGVPERLIDYRWFDPPSSNRWELDANAGRIAFTVLDTRPIKLSALARVPVHGDEIAEIASSYTGVGYSVNAWVVEPPNPPMTWDPVKGGLQPVPRGQRATHERITLRAELQGGVAPDGLRWQWSVNEGTGLSNPISQTPTVSRSEPGDIQARVTASDRDGRKLGEAEVGFSVVALRSAPATGPEKAAAAATSSETAPAAAVATATPSAPTSKPAFDQMVQEARDQVRRGDMQAAEQAVIQARKRDRAKAVGVVNEVARAAADSGWKAAHARDFNTALNDLRVANRLAPMAGKIAEKLARTERSAKQWPTVEAKAAEFDRLLADRQVWSAHAAMREMEELQFNMPGQMSNPLSQRVMDDFNHALEAYNAFMQEKSELHTRYFREQNWQAMLDSALATRGVWELNANGDKDVQGRIDFARQMLREQSAGSGKSVGPEGSNMADAVVAAVVTAAATAAVAVESAASVPPPDEAAAIAAQQIEQGPGQKAKQKAEQPAPVRNGKSATLTPGWDRTDSPLASGKVEWESKDLRNGQRSFAATFVLKGAEPNHSYTVGVHFFEPPGTSLPPVSQFGGRMLGNTRTTLSREGRTATILGGWDFGQLTTNAKGNGRATFRFEIPAAEYHLQFTVRQGECDPTRGVTAGCDAVYRSGGRFAEAFESIEAPRQVAKAAKAQPATREAVKLGPKKLHPIETGAGVYEVRQKGGEVRVRKTGPNPGGLQHAGMGLGVEELGGPVAGDFEVSIAFDKAKIDGDGLNQIELQTRYEGGAVFYVVRDREGRGCHVWAPGIQGDGVGGSSGSLRIVRSGGQVTGYCNDQALWSTRIDAPLVGLQFVLQNNDSSNDPTSVTFSKFRFRSIAGGQPATDDPVSASPAAGIAGNWKTSYQLATLAQNGDQVTGSYRSDGGEIIGTYRNGVLEGFWIENRSDKRCATPKGAQGRFHWGRLRWVFTGDRFVGDWGHCDGPLDKKGDWTGARE